MQQHDRSFHVHGVKVSLFLLITLISTGFLNTFFSSKINIQKMMKKYESLKFIGVILNVSKYFAIFYCMCHTCLHLNQLDFSTSICY